MASNYSFKAKKKLEQVPDAGLINGIGRYNKGPQVVRARVNVQSGKRYRFRVINISAYASFRFSIEGHPLTIIEVHKQPAICEHNRR